MFVTMVHEEVHDRAGQEEQEWQRVQHMRGMLGEEIIARDDGEPDEDEFGAARHLAAVMGLMIRHGVFLREEGKLGGTHCRAKGR